MSGPVTVQEIQATLPTGIVIHSYIKHGGQGSVFSGEYHGQQSAIKLVNPASTETKRIQREAEFLKKTNHPNIVKLFDHCEITLRTQPVQLLAYEFLDKGDLSSHIAPGTLPSSASVIKIATCIGSAINTLWLSPERVVHRDIKPENIMLNSAGEYLLVDFGFAKHIDLSDMTIAGSPGTRGYSSPEQAAGRKNLTLKSDIFSLGVTLFVYATGLHPYNGAQPLANSAIEQNIFALRPDFDPKLSQLIISMLNPSPSDRPTDLLTQLSQIKA